jgi:hypothetical protein
MLKAITQATAEALQRAYLSHFAESDEKERLATLMLNWSLHKGKWSLQIWCWIDQ